MRELWRLSHTDVRDQGKVNPTHGRNAQDRTGQDMTRHDRASHAHNRSKHTASPSRMGRRHAGMSHDRTGTQQHILYCGCSLWLLTVDAVSCCYLSSTAILVSPCLVHLSRWTLISLIVVLAVVAQIYRAAAGITTVKDGELAALQFKCSVFQHLFFSGICVLQSVSLAVMLCMLKRLSASCRRTHLVPQQSNCKKLILW